MSAVTTNLVQGPARIFFAASGSTLPAAADLAALKAGTLEDWTEVGHTTSAVTLTDTPTIVEANSQQAARTLAVAVSRWETTLETTCREVTLEAIRRAAHGAVNAGTLSPSSTTAAEVLSFAIVGPWSGGDECLIVVENGVVTNGVSMAFDRENYTEVPMTVRVLEGATLPAGYKVSVIA
jgi:hypothetical protein